MSKFRIKKTKKDVVLYLVGQKPIKGSVFLNKIASTHHGAERVLDLLALPEPFIPFENDDGNFWMVQKNAIVKIVVDAEYELEILRSYGAGVAIPKEVMVLMVGGVEERGTILVESQEQMRAFDEVNRTRGFLLLDCGENIQLLGCASIVAIKEPP